MKATLKRVKTWGVFLAVVFLALSVSVPALASSAAETRRSGSITINIPAVGMDVPRSGIGFTVYQVAGMSQSGDYYLTNDFSGSGLQLDHLSAGYEVSAASRALESYVSMKKPGGTSHVTDANGTAKFNDLALGYYFVTQSADSPGPKIGLICDSFLVAVPMKNSLTGSLIYDVVTDSKSQLSCGAVILNKVNGAGAPLPGAVFRLERKIHETDHMLVPPGVQTGSDGDGFFYWSTRIAALATDSYGQAAITGLPFGEYRLLETAAPAGYVFDSTPHGFIISAYGSVKLESGRYVKSSGTVQPITVYNYPPYYPPPPVYPPPPGSSVPPASSPPSSGSAPPESSSPASSAESGAASSHSGFDFPKTGGSVFYAVCTMGGIILALCGAAMFAVSRKKK